MNKFVYEYWNRTELGRKMIASESVSDSDLLFLIPNNVKRRHGLPVTRTYGKRKSAIKKARKRIILSFRLFDLINDVVEETLHQKWCDEEFFGQFVDFKNLELGDRNAFVFDKTNIVTMPTFTKPIKMYIDSGT